MADLISPSFTINTDTSINLKIQATDAITVNQGYTYNEAGLTFNAIGVQYGGFADGAEDIVPTVFVATQTTPHIVI